MVNNTTSGAAHADVEHDIANNSGNVALGAAITTAAPTATPIPTSVPIPSTSGVSNVSLLVYVANSIPKPATVVNNLVAVTNQAYVDSNVNMKITATKVVIINDLTPTNQYSALAYVSGISTADRVAAQADFVTFIHPLKAVQGLCGLANLNGGKGTAFTKRNSFSVVSYGTDGGFYCNNFTLAHELGHTMGMVHDVAHSIGVVGHYPDSYGYGLANAYGDIMSYFPQNGVFSTPTKFWANAARFPYGVLNKADVSRGLRLSAPEYSLIHTLSQ
jgi:hypothetical protein